MLNLLQLILSLCVCVCFNSIFFLNLILCVIHVVTSFLCYVYSNFNTNVVFCEIVIQNYIFLIFVFGRNYRIVL